MAHRRPPPVRPLGAARRRGTSLVELLAALVLFAIVGAATLRALDRQARLHEGLLVILESNAQHAAAHEAVAVQLRGLSPPAGDLARLSDSAVAFRLPVGIGLACDVTPPTIDLVPDTTAAGQTFSAWHTSPQPGDSVWVFDEGATDMAADDGWVAAPVAAVTRTAGRCPGSALLDPVLDAARPAWRLTLAGPLPSTVIAGAAVRLTRLARFAQYRGATGEYWLGFSEVNPMTAAWITIQPMSGPYLPFNAAVPASGGVALGARDSSGAPAAPLAMPASVRLATRTRAARSLRMDGRARGPFLDSLHTVIALRNAR